MVREMLRGIQRILQFVDILSLAFCVASVVSGAGCSRRPWLRGLLVGEHGRVINKPMRQSSAVIIRLLFLFTKGFLRRSLRLALYHLGYVYGQTGDLCPWIQGGTYLF
jgi:hypothetical protein